MGLNYNYMLYFPKDRMWDVLQGLAEICDCDGMTPTTIHFPDHDLVLPLMTSWGKSSEQAFDQPEYEFAISMYFDEDEAIMDYLLNRDGGSYERSPPDEKGINRVAIGFIYLTVYADLSKHYAFTKPTDMVLLSFGTTGTKMSLLFYDSTSIRKTFVNLLNRFSGLIGIFDLENDYGQLFWFKGEEKDFTLESNYMLPEEIEVSLKRGW